MSIDSDIQFVEGWALPAYDNHFRQYCKPYFENCYQQPVFDASMEITRHFGVVIDVGAHVGFFTSRYCAHFDTVHSFEPVAQNFRCLEQNTAGATNVLLHNVGLGSASEKAEISLPDVATNCGAWSIADFTQYSKAKKNEEIEIVTLDSLDIQCDLIKVDIQGYEGEFLKGAINTISKHLPSLVIENVTDDIQSTLHYLGYEEYVPPTKVKHDRFFYVDK